MTHAFALDVFDGPDLTLVAPIRAEDVSAAKAAAQLLINGLPNTAGHLYEAPTNARPVYVGFVQPTQP
ncbi:MAG TPA: hypothetical protein VK453_25575 [Micromonosporaceae bacterium]|nr:hypothetical protein [Micromonosporaceae bacterium]